MLDELDVERSNTEGLITLAEEEVALQKKELRRVESLARTNVASQSELDSTRRAELTARNSVLTLKNKVRLLSARRGRLEQEKERIGAELAKAKLDRARTELRAPIDGVIMHSEVEQDGYVSRGTKLLSIEDTSKAEIRFNLTLDELRWLWKFAEDTGNVARDSYALPDVPVTVVVSLAGLEFHWSSRLSRYDGAGIDATTRPLEVSLAAICLNTAPGSIMCSSTSLK